MEARREKGEGNDSPPLFFECAEGGIKGRGGNCAYFLSGPVWNHPLQRKAASGWFKPCEDQKGTRSIVVNWARNGSI